MHPHAHFRRAAILSALAAIYPAIAWGAGAARVDFAIGGVTAQQGAGSTKRSLTKGAEVFPGETIQTNDGMAQLRFTDGAQVSLKAGSEFRIDEYRFTGKADGEEKGFFSLLKGGLRTITGLVGKTNRGNYQVKTTVATIGIRGTEYSVTYGNSINVNTADGVVEVCNSSGCLLLYPGDEGYVQQDSTPPVLVQTGEEKPKKDDAPPELSDVEAPSNDRNNRGETTVFASGGLTGTQTYRILHGHWLTSGSFSAGAPFQQGTIDAAGALVSFTDGTYPYSPGTGSVTMLGNDGIVAWGRWVGGTGATFGFSSAEGGELHYVAGLPTQLNDPALGTTASYSLLGGSVSGRGFGSGTIDSASLSVTFTGGGSSVDINSLLIGMTVSGNSYVLSGNSTTLTHTGNLTFGGSSVSVTNSGSFAGLALVSGSFYGQGAVRAGTSFSFDHSAFNTTVAGAVTFTRN